MNRLSIAGQRFSRLTVISFAYVDDNRHTQWNCHCDCGSDAIVKGSNLTLGLSHSCGCLAREINSRRDHGKLDIVELKSRHLWQAAKFRAKYKKLNFNLDKSDIKIPERCPFLDTPFVFNKGKQRSNSPTLDRIIPHLGYVKGNVRVISMKANWMKSNSTLEEFEFMAKNWRSLS